MVICSLIYLVDLGKPNMGKSYEHMDQQIEI
jgi:hypothetical protein